MNKVNFEVVDSSEVVTVAGVPNAQFLRPSAEFISGPITGDYPETLAFDSEGYLFPDPSYLVPAVSQLERKAKKPLNATKQAIAITSAILEYQHARGLKGALEEEGYLLAEGGGGLGKSYTVEWFFAKQGIPCIIAKVPDDPDMALDELFGKPRALNENEGNLVETAKQVYRGRGITNPETKAWLKTGNNAARLYQALHPDGWAKTNPKAYNAFWTELAEKEGITANKSFIPKLGLFEIAHRNGMTLFLDELNRMHPKVREACMRAFESSKDLELYGGRVLKESDKTGFIIGAMNGSREGYSTKPLDKAQRRRAKLVTIPNMDQDDVVAMFKFMITGQPEKSSLLNVKGIEDMKFDGGICDSKFVNGIFNGAPQKVEALKAIADMHLFMDEQMAQAEQGKGWMKGVKRELTETLPTGPVLMKSFMTRSAQLIGNDDTQGIASTISKLSQAFEDVYVKPLVDAGIPKEFIMTQVAFGKFGMPDAPKKLAPESLTHFASLFSPFTTQDMEKVKKGVADLQISDGGVYPVVNKAGERTVGISRLVNGVMKFTQYPDVDYPLHPDRGVSELSMVFVEGLDYKTNIDWANVETSIS